MNFLEALFGRDAAYKREVEFQRRWGELVDYNSLRAKGVLFDPNHVARMRELQREYNEWIAAEYAER